MSLQIYVLYPWLLTDLSFRRRVALTQFVAEHPDLEEQRRRIDASPNLFQIGRADVRRAVHDLDEASLEIVEHGGHRLLARIDRILPVEPARRQQIVRPRLLGRDIAPIGCVNDVDEQPFRSIEMVRDRRQQDAVRDFGRWRASRRLRRCRYRRRCRLPFPYAPATNAATTIVAATAAHARRSLRIHGVHHGAFCSGSLWRMRCHTSRPYCSPRAGASGVAIMASVAAISLYVVAHAVHVPRWASMSSRRRASP